MIIKILIIPVLALGERRAASIHVIGYVKSNTTLACHVFGNPTPEIKWSRDHKKPLPQGRSRVINGYLYINKIEESDGGVYKCDVKKKSGTITKRVILLEVKSKGKLCYIVTVNWLFEHFTSTETPSHAFQSRDSAATFWVGGETQSFAVFLSHIIINNCSPNAKWIFKEWTMSSVRPSNSGCTRIAGRTRR